jgi:2,4-dienoyl-CoA reductase-like NADH-dependent reductase (Old Yellow Enzyme family)
MWLGCIRRSAARGAPPVRELCAHRRAISTAGVVHAARRHDALGRAGLTPTAGPFDSLRGMGAAVGRAEDRTIRAAGYAMKMNTKSTDPMLAGAAPAAIGGAAAARPPTGGARIAFTPGKLGALTLRNRIIKTATYEGMSPGGVPSPALVDFHRRLAAGGIAMTTVAYCAVSPNGRTFSDQLWMRDDVVPALRRLTDAVHSEGAAASIQLSHCGYFSRNRALTIRRPLGPSFRLNEYGLMSGLPFAGGMTAGDIAEVVEDFGRAAARARAAGFDALEIHLGHGYLLSQFLSPATNRRRDQFGGSLENRLRFPLAVLARVRAVVGAATPIVAKTNLRDGFRGGLEIDESVDVVRRLEAAGVDAVELSGGFVSKNPFFLLRGGKPLAEMIAVEHSWPHRLSLRLFGPSLMRAYPFEEMFFLPAARAVRGAVRLPLVLLGGIVSIDNLDTAMAAGFEFVALGRALIADPDLVRRMERGEATRTRCNACNQCVAEMDAGGVRCVLDGPRPPKTG